MSSSPSAPDARTLVIIGVDPGKETGIVVYHRRKLRMKKSLPAVEVTPWILNELDHYDETVRTVIAVERYNIGTNTVRKTRQLDALEITAQLKLVVRHRRGRVTYRAVNQADSKKLAHNQRLKDIGWWTIGNDHINDGARVALAALAIEDVTAFAEVVCL